MNDQPDRDPLDWSQATFAGAERQNLRAWRRLSFDEKLRANEEMNQLADEAISRLQTHGLPFIDPATGERFPGRKTQ